MIDRNSKCLEHAAERIVSVAWMDTPLDELTELSCCANRSMPSRRDDRSRDTAACAFLTVSKENIGYRTLIERRQQVCCGWFARGATFETQIERSIVAIAKASRGLVQLVRRNTQVEQDSLHTPSKILPAACQQIGAVYDFEPRSLTERQFLAECPPTRGNGVRIAIETDE
jgi:hypothetical protein